MTDNDARVAGEGLGSARNAVVAERFVELADTLVDDFDVVDLMDSLVTTCSEVLHTAAAGLCSWTARETSTWSPRRTRRPACWS